MKIISYNVNGIRAAIKKGFVDWLASENPDVVCIQETKACEDQVNTDIIEELGYRHYWFGAEKKGYSGVAILCKHEPNSVVYGTGIDYMDSEGRNIRVDFDNVSVMSMYLPSASNMDRLGFKLRYMDDFLGYTSGLKETLPNLIICGDYNICHREIDIHDPVRNAKVSGFLPEEREWLSKFINSGFIDSFRKFCADPDRYSWWTYRANARANNKGWRIDYNMVSESLADNLVNAEILSDIYHSDHCPISLEIDI